MLSCNTKQFPVDYTLCISLGRAACTPESLSRCSHLRLCTPLGELQASLPVPQSHMEGQQDLAKGSLQIALRNRGVGTSAWRWGFMSGWGGGWKLASHSGSVHANTVKWGTEADQSLKPGGHPSSHGLQKPKVRRPLPLPVQMCTKTLSLLRLLCFQVSVSSSREEGP